MPPAGADQLAIFQEPSATVTAGVVFPRQPIIQIQDASGNRLERAGVSVTAAVASGDGTLLGTTTRLTDVNGQAHFDNLLINGATGGHVLIFAAEGYASTASGTIDVQASNPGGAGGGTGGGGAGGGGTGGGGRGGMVAIALAGAVLAVVVRAVVVPVVVAAVALVAAVPVAAGEAQVGEALVAAAEAPEVVVVRVVVVPAAGGPVEAGPAAEVRAQGTSRPPRPTMSTTRSRDSITRSRSARPMACCGTISIPKTLSW